MSVCSQNREIGLFRYLRFQLFVYLIASRCTTALLETNDPIDQESIVFVGKLGSARLGRLNDRADGSMTA